MQSSSFEVTLKIMNQRCMLTIFYSFRVKGFGSFYVSGRGVFAFTHLVDMLHSYFITCEVKENILFPTRPWHVLKGVAL